MAYQINSNIKFTESLSLPSLAKVMAKVTAIMKKDRLAPKTALENLHQSMFKKTRKEK